MELYTSGGPEARYTSAGGPEARYTSAGGPEARYTSAGGPEVLYTSAGGPEALYTSAGGPEAPAIKFCKTRIMKRSSELSWSKIFSRSIFFDSTYYPNISRDFKPE
jgi:hypothetical protein